MSIFIANLSFGSLETLNIAKLSVLLGSMVSAIVGMLILKQSSTKNQLEK